jgi:type III secretory pathway component EscT
MSHNREFTLGSVVNLGTLLIGLVLGFAVGVEYNAMKTSKVFAADQKPSETVVEEITPGIGIGSIGTAVVMSHQVEADILVVNGFDMMKLQQGLLDYLSSRPLAERADFQNIVDRSKPDKFYKIKATAPPAAAPPATPPVGTPATGGGEKPK